LLIYYLFKKIDTNFLIKAELTKPTYLFLKMLPKISKTIKQIATTDVVIKYSFKLKFDGCSKGNPGLAGAGAVLYFTDDDNDDSASLEEIWATSQFVGAKATNNEAEYMGLIIGLKRAIEMNIKELNVEGDSLLVIKQMLGEYNVKSENLFKLYNEAKECQKQFKNITFTHIYRNQNKRADQLSNLAILPR